MILNDVEILKKQVFNDFFAFLDCDAYFNNELHRTFTDIRVTFGIVSCILRRLETASGRKKTFEASLESWNKQLPERSHSSFQNAFN